MLVKTNVILNKANRGRYAVGAFNVNNLEILQAVIEAALKEKSPVIVQTSEGAIAYAGLGYLIAMVKEAAKAPIPVALHLDHGKEFSLIKQAIKYGYSSVMFDGSILPYSQNVSQTKRVVKIAHARRVPVEAELGSLPGKEDLVNVAAREALMTDPEQARIFVTQTGCDFLAVAVGTAHGAYKFAGASRLDYDRLKTIKKLTQMPLVLHGASGVPLEMLKINKKYCRLLNDCQRFENAKGVSDGSIKMAIKSGINKINIDTDLRIAFLTGIRHQIAVDHKVYDPRELLAPAKALMTKVARHKMRLFGCSGKA